MFLLERQGKPIDDATKDFEQFSNTVVMLVLENEPKKERWSEYIILSINSSCGKRAREVKASKTHLKYKISK